MKGEKLKESVASCGLRRATFHSSDAGVTLKHFRSCAVCYWKLSMHFGKFKALVYIGTNKILLPASHSDSLFSKTWKDLEVVFCAWTFDKEPK